MTELFTNEVKNKLEKKYGAIVGENTENAKLFQHTGNWAYRPQLFFCERIEDAVASARNLEASLYQFNEKTGKWDVVYEIEWFIEWDEDSRDLLNSCLKKLGYDRSIFKDGEVNESFYRGWERSDIPKGAYEIVPGVFI